MKVLPDVRGRRNIWDKFVYMFRGLSTEDVFGLFCFFWDAWYRVCEIGTGIRVWVYLSRYVVRILSRSIDMSRCR